MHQLSSRLSGFPYRGTSSEDPETTPGVARSGCSHGVQDAELVDRPSRRARKS